MLRKIRELEDTAKWLKETNRIRLYKECIKQISVLKNKKIIY